MHQELVHDQQFLFELSGSVKNASGITDIATSVLIYLHDIKAIWIKINSYT